jgi:hypothetical protein
VPSDDPREILRTAGLECIEVGAYEKRLEYLAEYDRLHGDDAYDEADAAIDKLECLVAKYKWQRGKLAERLLTERIAAAVKMTHDRNLSESIAESYRWKDRICAAIEEEWEVHMKEMTA